MALTNLLPTIIHIGIALAGLAVGHFSRKRQSLEKAIRIMRGPSMLIVQGAPQAESLSKLEAQDVVDFLFVDRWLYAGITLLLLLLLYPAVTAVLAWAFGRRQSSWPAGQDDCRSTGHPA